MTAPCCARPYPITWTEPSMLVVPPDWWDHDQLGPFQPPPPQTTTTTLCLHCGHTDIDIDLSDPGNHELRAHEADGAMWL